MTSITYSGTFNGQAGSDDPTAILYSSSVVPSGSVISKVTYSIRMKSNKYSSSYDWNLVEFSVGTGGGSPSASDYAAMTSGEITFTGSMSFSASDVSKFSNTYITVYAYAYNNHPSDEAVTRLWEASITVEYINTAPTIGVINDLAINGTSSYTGTGPATLTWTAPAYNGSFHMGPYISLHVEDGGSWEDVPGPENVTSVSFALTDEIITHIAQNNKEATIWISVFGYDSDFNMITSESNKVFFIYSEPEPTPESSHYLIKCYIDGKWENCIVYYFDGNNWIECVPYYYNGTAWQTCSF